MNYYLLARQIHRLLVLIVTAIFLVMATTGLLIRFPLARFIHGNLSTIFVIVLGLMAVSGLTMYFFPVLRKFIQK